MISVQRSWPIASMDISCAFLKGLTFEEIAKIKGTPKRQVSMRLPRGRKGCEPAGSRLLRKLEGFQTFCDAIHVLELLKGGFGLVDAPALFTGKVDITLKEKGMYSTRADRKFYVKIGSSKFH